MDQFGKRYAIILCLSMCKWKQMPRKPRTNTRKIPLWSRSALSLHGKPRKTRSTWPNEIAGFDVIYCWNKLRNNKITRLFTFCTKCYSVSLTFNSDFLSIFFIFVWFGSLVLAMENSLNVMIQMFFFRFATYFSAVASYFSCYHHCHKNHSTNILPEKRAQIECKLRRSSDR